MTTLQPTNQDALHSIAEQLDNIATQSQLASAGLDLSYGKNDELSDQTHDIALDCMTRTAQMLKTFAGALRLMLEVDDAVKPDFVFMTRDQYTTLLHLSANKSPTVAGSLPWHHAFLTPDNLRVDTVTDRFDPEAFVRLIAMSAMEQGADRLESSVCGVTVAISPVGSKH